MYDLIDSWSNQSIHRQPVEQLFTDAEPYFSALIQSIDNARSSIDMEVYIYEANYIGQNIAQALSNAAQRGVTVRLLIDGVGIDSNFKAIAENLEQHSVQIRIHRPLPWRTALWKYSVSQTSGLRKLILLLFSLNQRNHRKTVVIDESIVFVGSINVSHNHLHLEHGGQQWRDTAIKITKGENSTVRQAFNIAWNDVSLLRETHEKNAIIRAINSPFLLNYSTRLRKHHRKLLLKKIITAKRHVLITNAYFVPEPLLLRALTRAAKRGVNIEIMLPASSDVFFMPWVSAFFYKALLTSGARIFEYQPSMLHAKTIVIDNWASIGSSNLNHRSFRNDLEIDYIAQQGSTIASMLEIFEQDKRSSEEQKLAELSLKKGWRLWLGGFFLLVFGRWL